MNKECARIILTHVGIAVTLPLALGFYFSTIGNDWDHGLSGSIFFLFTGVLPLIFVFIGEQSPLFVPIVVLVRLAIVAHYPFRVFKRPNSKKRMIFENILLTVLTAGLGYFIMFISVQ